MPERNIPKIKAPNVMLYANEYYYNDGYFFANCEIDRCEIDTGYCEYLKHGCISYFDATAGNKEGEKKT